MLAPMPSSVPEALVVLVAPVVLAAPMPVVLPSFWRISAPAKPAAYSSSFAAWASLRLSNTAIKVCCMIVLQRVRRSLGFRGARCGGRYCAGRTRPRWRTGPALALLAAVLALAGNFQHRL